MPGTGLRQLLGTTLDDHGQGPLKGGRLTPIPESALDRITNWGLLCLNLISELELCASALLSFL